MTQKNSEQPGFNHLGIAPKLLGQVAKQRFTEPTPIQHKAIPVALKGRDVIGIAQTGTGKTLAFAIPMIQHISREGGTGLVLLPTRELAEQVNDEFAKLGKDFGLRTAILIGGASMNMQIRDIRKRPHVIIATPGRLIDLLEQKVMTLKDVRYLVLDEADRMLDMGFEPQIKKVLIEVSPDRQTFLFSATMPDKIAKIVKKYMRDPERIEVAPAGTAAALVRQEGYVVEKADRTRLLVKILTDTEGKILVFSRTKHGARKIAVALRRCGFKAAELHSDRSQAQRREALDGFKSGKVRILVATDIASRGIDVADIARVINFDVPDQIEDYIHRIGRTGRAGKKGIAVSFIAPDQKIELNAIENLIHNRLYLRDLPELPVLPSAPKGVNNHTSRRPYGRSPRGGGGSRSRSSSAPRRSGGGGSRSRSSSSPRRSRPKR
ncbi:MAG: DEAD/DEAH box helicase [Candidatus Uhrbacteria bacterium]|nr:DEAD/DEAH box helicase [Patescibacteria group bacterium]MBU1907007.1 DEAD/DEAH box helicase [Patescibacteria group bacterium]